MKRGSKNSNCLMVANAKRNVKFQLDTATNYFLDNCKNVVWNFVSFLKIITICTVNRVRGDGNTLLTLPLFSFLSQTSFSTLSHFKACPEQLQQWRQSLTPRLTQVYVRHKISKPNKHTAEQELTCKTFWAQIHSFARPGKRAERKDNILIK